MRLMISFLTAAAAAGLGSTASAQERTAPRTPESRVRVAGPETCTNENGRIECRVIRRVDMDSTLKKRAALGVELGATGTVRDTIGVFVARVTPRGPAENAGVIEGDRIVSINGVDLRVNAADAGDSYAAGLPSRRLTREVQKLAPGSRINLRVWSGGRTRDVQVTAGSAFDLRERGSFGYMLDGMPGRTMTMPSMESGSFPRMMLRTRPRVHVDAMPKVHFDEEFEHGIEPLKTKEVTKTKK